MRERIERWLLLTGNRYVVAAAILAVMTGIGAVPAVGHFVIRETGPLSFLASGLITGNVTLITVVVAINQVVLSQELESPGSLREEIERTAEYRRSALDGSPGSPVPGEFLRALVEQIGQHARTLEELLPGSADETSERLRTELPEHCERVADHLDGRSGELSAVIAPIVGADYAEYVHDCHRLRERFRNEGDDRLHAALDRLGADLEHLDVARQYFVTMFMKEELAKLSRSLLYVGIVAVSVPVALLVELAAYTDFSLPAPALIGGTLLAILAGLAPLALLIAFIIRIATVAQHIAAITPFKS